MSDGRVRGGMRNWRNWALGVVCALPLACGGDRVVPGETVSGLPAIASDPAAPGDPMPLNPLVPPNEQEIVLTLQPGVDPIAVVAGTGLVLIESTVTPEGTMEIGRASCREKV